MGDNSVRAGGGLTEEKKGMYEVRLAQIIDSLVLVAPVLALFGLGSPCELVSLVATKDQIDPEFPVAGERERYHGLCHLQLGIPVVPYFSPTWTSLRVGRKL